MWSGWMEMAGLGRLPHWQVPGLTSGCCDRPLLHCFCCPHDTECQVTGVINSSSNDVSPERMRKGLNQWIWAVYRGGRDASVGQTWTLESCCSCHCLRPHVAYMCRTALFLFIFITWFDLSLSSENYVKYFMVLSHIQLAFSLAWSLLHNL